MFYSLLDYMTFLYGGGRVTERVEKEEKRREKAFCVYSVTSHTFLETLCHITAHLLPSANLLH